MSSINKVILIGRLGADPDTRYTAGGSCVCTLSLATNEAWTDKSGKRQERTEWHRVVVWAKLAEACSKYLSKGRTVYIEGRITTRTWDDNSGNKRYSTEIVAKDVQFLGGGGNRDGDQPSRADRYANQGQTQRTAPDDDLPF